jgi:hypothetical protein
MRRLHLIRQHAGPFRRYLRSRPRGWRDLVAILTVAVTINALLSPVAYWVKICGLGAMILATTELYWHAIEGYLDDRSKTRTREDIWKD